MKQQAFWAKDLVSVLDTMADQLILIQNIHRQIQLSREQSSYQTSILLELMSNIGYKHWLSPKLPAMEKVLSPIVENTAEEEVQRTEVDLNNDNQGPAARDNSDPTLDTFILHSQLTIHQTPLHQKFTSSDLAKKNE